MENEFNQVKEFHKKLGVEISDSPTLLTCNTIDAMSFAEKISDLSKEAKEIGKSKGLLFKRLSMALEELAEWLEAHGENDLVAAADAWADRAYILFGDAVSTGLPVDAIFNEVHRSNMTKVTLPPSASGKAQKNATYEKPDLKTILARFQ